MRTAEPVNVSLGYSSENVVLMGRSPRQASRRSGSSSRSLVPAGIGGQSREDETPRFRGIDDVIDAQERSDPHGLASLVELVHQSLECRLALGRILDRLEL